MNVNFNKLRKFIGANTQTNVVLYTGSDIDYEEQALEESLDWYRNSVARNPTTTLFIGPTFQKINEERRGCVVGLDGILELLRLADSWDTEKVIVMIEPTYNDFIKHPYVYEAVENQLLSLQEDENTILIWYTANKEAWRPNAFNYYV